MPQFNKFNLFECFFSESKKRAFSKCPRIFIYFDFFMEAIHLRSVDDEIPSSPIAYAQERNSFCIANTSQNLHSFVNCQKNQINTDIETTLVLPIESLAEALQNNNLSNYNNQILLPNERNNHISLKKRLKKGPVTFKPFESFRALEETVRELNCYFQSEYRKNQNNTEQTAQTGIEHSCPKIKISVQ